MTKHDLKELAAIGAELGAAKAENEMLRGLLREAQPYVAARAVGPMETSHLLQRIRTALSQQAESECIACEGHPAVCNNPCALCGKQAKPTDTYTAVDMATAAAQGCRDGQAAVEPAPAQDERTDFEAWAKSLGVACTKTPQGLMFAGGRRVPVGGYILAETALAWAAWKARAYRAAQTEQQPEQSGLVEALRPIHAMILNALDRDAEEGKAARGEMAAELRAALSAQGAGDASA